ncbi:MAG TPA: fluoride efflux transporter CrcB [Methylophilaceae bacterium]|nr:fluoride efflux transporter CrcB [Methylophilaceae bacterium]
MGFNGFIAVGIGAAIGAWARWGLSWGFNAVFPLLPMGTLIANLSGGYMMGLTMGFAGMGGVFTPELRLLITTGFLGGLTTFSTFSAEAVDLFSQGEYGWASMHILSHVVGSLLMTALGVLTVQMLKS